MTAYFFLISFYLLSVGVIGSFIYQAYRQAFSFHLLFSLIYFVTFYSGFPFSMVLAIGFDMELQSGSTLFLTLVTSLIGYFIYYAVYQKIMPAKTYPMPEKLNFVKLEAKITACILALVAISTLGYFLYLNGLLLFKLEKYSQLFAKDMVQGIALKRFFYFLFPALLIVFFLYNNKKAWWTLLLIGGLFGGLSYIAVGGTRANLALAFAFFLLIGIYQRYISFTMLIGASLVSLIAMFFLALARYNLDVSGSEAIYTFLYLSRDTFSPWENVSLIFSEKVEYQGLMPIVRDFYVYIPQFLWQDRPDIVWNTANYFTKEILANFSGLAISPTLIGSFYIMGGFPLIVIGMAFVGVLIRALDNLFAYGKARNSALLQAYCFGNLFNLIVLVREGMDAFVSRFVFFSVIFVICWGGAKLILLGKNNDRQSNHQGY